MNLTEFHDAKTAARRRFGPGTLICYIGADALERLRHEQDRGHYIGDEIPEDLHADVIFRIQPFGPVRFALLDEEGPFVDT
jgi:hypothetical protein